MTMSNKTYDLLKWWAQVTLPALGTFYFAFADIWHLPYAAQVVGTIVALDALLGALLGISAKQYNQKNAGSDGRLVVDSTNPLKDVVAFEFRKDVADLIKQEKVVFTVERGIARSVPTATDDSADL